MEAARPNLSRSIFEEPPDDLGEQEVDFGALLLRVGGLEGIEIARSFAEAGNRLLDAAAVSKESWEAALPILFCYRHALELYLKALLPDAPKNHKLAELAKQLPPLLQAYPTLEVDWLLTRIAEFDRVDPASTVFRYHDGALTSYKNRHAPDELWVDFHHLGPTMRLVFEALETLRRHSLDRQWSQP